MRDVASLPLSEVRRLHESWIERADPDRDPGFPGVPDSNLYRADDDEFWRSAEHLAASLSDVGGPPT